MERIMELFTDVFVLTGLYCSVWLTGLILEIELVDPYARVCWDETTWYGYLLIVVAFLGVIRLPFVVKEMFERWGRS